MDLDKQCEAMRKKIEDAKITKNQLSGEINKI
jgi:hypothetical protein